jgi:hypothetical protein
LNRWTYAKGDIPGEYRVKVLFVLDPEVQRRAGISNAGRVFRELDIQRRVGWKKAILISERVHMITSIPRSICSKGRSEH